MRAPQHPHAVPVLKHFAWLGLCLVMAASSAHAAKTTVQDPRINGQPIDFCSGPPGLNDCGAIGPVIAGTQFCKSIGKRTVVHSETKKSSGNAMHWDDSKWVLAPADAVFSVIVCGP